MMIDSSTRTGRTAVLLIAHGSRNETANDDLRRLAERLDSEGDHVVVVPSFLELAEPDIDEGARVCARSGAQRILMVPYFLSEGIHIARDLVEARARLAGEYSSIEFKLARPLGPHSLLDTLVKERIREVEGN